MTLLPHPSYPSATGEKDSDQMRNSGLVLAALSTLMVITVTRPPELPQANPDLDSACRTSKIACMTYDPDKIADAVLALLWHNQQSNGSAWKSFPWDATDRLFEKGLIDDPRAKRKSVWLTKEGEIAAEQAFARLFGK